MTDIHENLPPIQLDFFTPLDWVIVCIVTIGFLLILWKVFSPEAQKQVSTQKKTTQKFIPLKFSFSRAVKRLKNLEKKERWKEFAIESIVLLKKILEKKYRTPFDFATGKELQEIIAKKDISPEQSLELKYFFQQTDPIVFAQKIGKDESAKEILRILEKWNLSLKK